ncbi:hypothetical protein DICVIV_12662 [Dictyocaulus viviparus]|uniref:Uncharacterized protein n=1 Tax=Dictyocaulus viviparus TaxID=29172 RepID=A0A0D8XG63_DICVI|nr:hypothetical protein DICVIV_12662 [Dictyocaulus viviparus]
MCDSNAWDMIGEPIESSTAPKSALCDSQHLLNIHDYELQALGIDKEEIVEEVERQRADRKRRSKSPALETLRRASINVLQKFGALSKKKDTVILLYKDHEVDTLPLLQYCHLLNIHDYELQALGIDKEEIVEEVERQRADRKRRSKSPALETLRRASINVLQKFGALSKKKDTVILLYKDHEVDTLPLLQYCVRNNDLVNENP